jgi:hypothetical protein
MKIRKGFVSNSSSSSFIIPLHKITDEQKQMIYNHIEIGKKIDEELIKQGKEPYYEYYEDWNIKEDDYSIWCYTFMDNFQLIDLVIDEIKVHIENILRFGDGQYWYELYEDPKYLKFKRLNKLNRIIKKIQK